MASELPVVESDRRLIWIDLEMTGLDTHRDSIIEIATVVTDAQLNVLAEGPEFAISHPLQMLEAMDEWNRNQHRHSGLWQRVLNSEIQHAQAEASTIAFYSNGSKPGLHRCVVIRFVRIDVSCIGRCRVWSAISITVIWMCPR